MGNPSPFRVLLHGFENLQRITRRTVTLKYAYDCTTVLSSIQTLVCLEIHSYYEGEPNAGDVDYRPSFLHVKCLELEVNAQWIPILSPSTIDRPPRAGDSFHSFIQRSFVNPCRFASNTVYQ